MNKNCKVDLKVVQTAPFSPNVGVKATTELESSAVINSHIYCVWKRKIYYKDYFKIIPRYESLHRPLSFRNALVLRLQ